MYRPPDRKIETCTDYFKGVLAQVKSENRYCYFLGDYNVDILNSDKHTATSDFLDIMYSHCYLPLINKPTRVNQRSSTLIDNIYTNCFIDTEFFTGILHSDISDHFPIFAINSSGKVMPKKDEIIFKRTFSERNISKFKEELFKINWEKFVYSIKDPQEAFSIFHSHVTKFYNKCFPVKRVKRGYKNRIPWLTDELKMLINIKNKLYVKSEKDPTGNIKEKYCAHKCKLNRLLRDAERNHYEELFTLYKNDLSRSWQVMKDIINKNKQPTTTVDRIELNGEIVTDKKRIVNSFNDYYINIGPNLSKSMPESDISPLAYMGTRVNNTMFINPTTEIEIRKHILSLKNSSPGWDEITGKILKETHECILKPLTYVFNLSLSQGVFPSELKIAKVIPLYKGDSKFIVSNYRPVSVLPVFSKILEKLMYTRLFSFINKNNLLYKLQFGFRPEHSTCLALISLIDKITDALEKGDFVLGLFLDFSKAFDCINHEILYLKLEHYGIRGMALKWFRSYLSNREQFVTFLGENFFT